MSKKTKLHLEYYKIKKPSKDELLVIRFKGYQPTPETVNKLHEQLNEGMINAKIDLILLPKDTYIVRRTRGDS